MEEEINFTEDIGRYIETLVRQGGLIVTLALVAALAAALVSALLPKQYQAKVLVATTKTSSAVSFGSAIETLSEEQLLSAGGKSLLDPAQRLQSYVQLVANPTVAQDVLDEFGPQLPPDQRTVQDLLDKISGEIAQRSDSIQITVTDEDPALAAEIANAWGKAYVEQVNAIYTGSGSAEAYRSVQEQSAQAKQQYDRAQAELESFIAQDRGDQLERQIEEARAAISSLTLAYQVVISDIVTTSSDAMLAAFATQTQDQQNRLNQGYAELQRVDQLLLDAQNMKVQLEAGGEGAAASNQLALTLLKAQVFANHGNPGDVQIQTQPADSSAAAMIADLAGLISALQGKRNALSGEINRLSAGLTGAGGADTAAPPLVPAQAVVQSLVNSEDLSAALNFDLAGSPFEQKIQSLEAQVRSLEAQLANEKDRHQELTRARNLAWETYKNLATKEAELAVAAQTSGVEVALAAPAAIPSEDTISLAKNTALAGVSGLLLGILAAYVIEFWWSYKQVKPYPLVSLRRRR